jgi:hypothetical protein
MRASSAALLRRVEPSLGLYFRPGRNDHTTLLRILAAEPPSFTGVVLDASLHTRHEDLRLHLRRRGLDVVLDPMALELATSGGWERPALRELDWAGSDPHDPNRLKGSGVTALADPIAKFAVEKGYTAVIAPTHFIRDMEDPWWSIDRRTVRRLRHQLDSIGGREIQIYYRLAVPRKTLVDREQRLALITEIAELQVDAIWLCIHPVSARSGPTVVQSYLELCRDFAAARLPLVAEKTGTLGLTLLGFNAIGGVEAGITIGESFDANRLLRSAEHEDEGRGFSMAPRVYFPELRAFLKRDTARTFLSSRGMKRRFACQGRACCETVEDMIRDPRRHFIFARASEVEQLGRIPSHNRPQVYVDMIREASDHAVHATKVDRRFADVQSRLGDLRLMLESMRKRGEFSETVVAPRRRRG